jgi:hypothetical protein
MFFESKKITLRSPHFLFSNVMPSIGVQIFAKGILKNFEFLPRYSGFGSKLGKFICQKINNFSKMFLCGWIELQKL